MQSILMLVNQVETKSPRVEIQYVRAVKPEGNVRAQQMLDEVFEYGDDWWRGLGVLKNSGLKIRSAYERHDAEKMIQVEVEETKEPKGCLCGEILRGVKKPVDCPLFGKACTPSNPIGSCMVSNEGSCQAYFLYNRLAQ
jgi:hydrogenase expression/formation protein HypD